MTRERLGQVNLVGAVERDFEVMFILDVSETRRFVHDHRQLLQVLVGRTAAPFRLVMRLGEGLLATKGGERFRARFHPVPTGQQRIDRMIGIPSITRRLLV